MRESHHDVVVVLVFTHTVLIFNYGHTRSLKNHARPARCDMEEFVEAYGGIIGRRRISIHAHFGELPNKEATLAMKASDMFEFEAAKPPTTGVGSGVGAGAGAGAAGAGVGASPGAGHYNYRKLGSPCPAMIDATPRLAYALDCLSFGLSILGWSTMGSSRGGSIPWAVPGDIMTRSWLHP
jgi:hypothetical protein